MGGPTLRLGDAVMGIWDAYAAPECQDAIKRTYEKHDYKTPDKSSPVEDQRFIQVQIMRPLDDTFFLNQISRPAQDE